MTVSKSGTEQPRVLSAPSTYQGRATHNMPPPPLKHKLLCLHALSNFENESVDKVKMALAFVQTPDPLLDRCSSSNHWIALIDEVKHWASEQELLHSFGDNLDSRIQLLNTQAEGVKGIVSSLSDTVKANKSIADVGTKFDQWWLNCWQNGDLVTHTMQFLAEVEQGKDKALKERSFRLATKVKDARERINDIVTLVFSASSQFWWLTIRLIKQSISDTPTAEAEPRTPELAKLEAFDRHKCRWLEMVEVLQALQTFGIKMPRAWTNVLRTTEARKAWLAFGSVFLRVAHIPVASMLQQTPLTI